MDSLKYSSLLEGVPIPNGECLSIHDLVRELDLRFVFMVQAGVGLHVAPKEKECVTNLEMISLMENEIKIISCELICSNLSTLFLQNSMHLKFINQ